MTTSGEIISKASEFVRRLFAEHLADYMVFHTLKHTQMVAKTARIIAEAIGLGEEGIEVVELAGLFHDTGYTEIYKGHEEASERIATEFLRQEDYPEEKIALVTGCIRATKIPQQPKNLLEEIIADADLSGFGRKSFFKKTELLRLEWETAFDKKFPEDEWAQRNLDLLTGHTYFTRFAKKTFSEQKAENIRKLFEKINAAKKTQNEEFSRLPEPQFIPSEPPLLPEYIGEDTPQLPWSPTVENREPSHYHNAQALMFINAVIIVILSLFLVSGMGITAHWQIQIPLCILLGTSGLAIIFSGLAIRPDSKKIIDPGRKTLFLRVSFTIFLYGIGASVLALLLFSLLRLS